MYSKSIIATKLDFGQLASHNDKARNVINTLDSSTDKEQSKRKAKQSDDIFKMTSKRKSTRTNKESSTYCSILPKATPVTINNSSSFYGSAEGNNHPVVVLPSGSISFVNPTPCNIPHQNSNQPSTSSSTINTVLTNVMNQSYSINQLVSNLGNSIITQSSINSSAKTSESIFAKYYSVEPKISTQQNSSESFKHVPIAATLESASANKQKTSIFDKRVQPNKGPVNSNLSNSVCANSNEEIVCVKDEICDPVLFHVNESCELTLNGESPPPYDDARKEQNIDIHLTETDHHNKFNEYCFQYTHDLVREKYPSLMVNTFLDKNTTMVIYPKKPLYFKTIGPFIDFIRLTVRADDTYCFQVLHKTTHSGQFDNKVIVHILNMMTCNDYTLCTGLSNYKHLINEQVKEHIRKWMTLERLDSKLCLLWHEKSSSEDQLDTICRRCKEILALLKNNNAQCSK